MILSDLNQQVIEIAKNAAAAILAVYQSDFSVQNKSDNSPLTEADLASHRTISDALRLVTPDIPVLSEESQTIAWSERQKWQQYWLLDPLDGTKEFVKRNGEFTVNIALIDKHKPMMGVVYVPTSDVCYYASDKSGAYKIENSAVKEIKTRKTDINHISVCGSRSHGSEKQHAFTQSLPANTEIMTIGSSLKFCLVAEGKADIYPRFGLTSEWDTAAAHCIVNEAGGKVVALNKHTLSYNKKESILNPEFVVIGDTHFDWSPYLSTE